MRHVTIGSRGSDLALWQAHHVKSQLEQLGCSVDIHIIKTQGDKIQHLSFDKMEGKGFFTKEIEAALLDREVDLAVHSHKDLETTSPEGLVISCVSERADPADILLIHPSAVNENETWSLKKNATVGTSSARRKSQVLHYRPDLVLNDLRGNVPTRINKLREQNYDAILLAKAGVDRLNIDLSEFKVIVLDPTTFVPAPAQGVLGLQIREEDTELHAILQKMNHPQVQRNIALERAILNQMQGGCQLPLGVHCTGDQLYVAFSPTAEIPARVLSYSVESHEGMAERVVAELKQVVAN